MTIAVIVQARMGSTRLPGKVMEQINGQPVLAHVLRRCDRIPGIDLVVCAIPDTPDNDCLAPVIEGCGAKVFRGAEYDVMMRYTQAARLVGADTVMRITADCPLIDPEVCGEVLALFRKEGADYASNVHPRSFPQGLDCEVFAFKTLEHFERVSREGREHVTTTMAYHRQVKTATLRSDYYRASERWTLDYPEDLDFVRAVYAVREPRRTADVFATLDKNPHIRAINACRRAA